ncbi:DUF4260 family protein [Bacillales bacterium AN1005]
MHLGFILSAHIGLVRIMGYRVKYLHNFKNTQMNRL